MQIVSYLSPCTKLKSRGIKDLNIKPDTPTLKEQKVGNSIKLIGTGTNYTKPISAYKDEPCSASAFSLWFRDIIKVSGTVSVHLQGFGLVPWSIWGPKFSRNDDNLTILGRATCESPGSEVWDKRQSWHSLPECTVPFEHSDILCVIRCVLPTGSIKHCTRDTELSLT